MGSNPQIESTDPMLATLARQPSSRKGWLFELEFRQAPGLALPFRGLPGKATPNECCLWKSAGAAFERCVVTSMAAYAPLTQFIYAANRL
jgi:hypothetical protein